jgi:hypothetical protein
MRMRALPCLRDLARHAGTLLARGARRLAPRAACLTQRIRRGSCVKRPRCGLHARTQPALTTRLLGSTAHVHLGALGVGRHSGKRLRRERASGRAASGGECAGALLTRQSICARAAGHDAPPRCARDGGARARRARPALRRAGGAAGRAATAGRCRRRRSVGWRRKRRAARRRRPALYRGRRSQRARRGQRVGRPSGEKHYGKGAPSWSLRLPARRTPPSAYRDAPLRERRC